MKYYDNFIKFSIIFVDIELSYDIFVQTTIN